MPCAPMVVSRSSRDSGESTSRGIRLIHLVVGELNEFLNAVKSQAECLRRRPASSKGFLLILQRQAQLRLREPKSDTMLAWGASFLITRHVPSLPCRCRQTVSKQCLSESTARNQKGAYRASPL